MIDQLEDLATNLRELQSYGTEIVVIDTPPALTASIEEVIAIADLVIIPARPSPHDLRAVGATVEMVRRAGKPFLFVVNGAAPAPNAALTSASADMKSLNGWSVAATFDGEFSQASRSYAELGTNAAHRWWDRQAPSSWCSVSATAY